MKSGLVITIQIVVLWYHFGQQCEDQTNLVEVFRFGLCVTKDRGYMYGYKISKTVGIISFNTNIGTT